MRIPSTVLLVVLAGCGNNNENTGTRCETAAQCYPGVDGGAILGTVTCLTKYPGGYCTHTCNADTECCAVGGECKTGIKQVCAPFETQPLKYCFFSPLPEIDAPCAGSWFTNKPNGSPLPPETMKVLAS